MTPHDHREHVPGCFRCELSRDEVEPARLGVRVWRERVQVDVDHFVSEFTEWIPSDDAEPGLWFATTPEAVAELRAMMVDVARNARTPQGTADIILRSLGFQDAE